MSPTEATEKKVLGVENLSVAFRSGDRVTRAVSHISFDLWGGRTLAIVGESGSGKSVSSLSIMHLLQKGKAMFDGGKFTFDLSDSVDKPLAFAPDDAGLKSLRGKQIAMIFQEPMTSLNPVMTCGDQVIEMLCLHKNISREKALQKTVELFEEVKLPRANQIINQYPHELSGGQRQRVMIAMAISCDPKILIADEPTTALDVTVQKEILVLLKSLQVRYQMAMIFITHDLGVVAEIADDILVMRKGEVVEQGSAHSVLGNPQHPYTKGLLACKPEPGKKSSRLLTVSDFLDENNLKTGPSISVISKPDVPNTANEKPLLRVQHLSKSYAGAGGIFHKKTPPIVAVNNVSFSIAKGETLGLVGESGCGKTTLSRMLLGLIPASQGEIIYSLDKTSTSDLDITKITANALRNIRKEIQIIFQDPYSALNPKHTIGEAITEPMMVFNLHEDKKKRKEKTFELLEKVGLSHEHYSRYPHEFSGGQRQRIVIARALACEPSFIICDESVSALDVSVQAQVLNLLNDLKRDFSFTYLFISHDLNVVYYMSDRIMVMNKGRIEEIGSADQIFFNPTNDYTKKLLAAIPGRS